MSPPRQSRRTQGLPPEVKPFAPVKRKVPEERIQARRAAYAAAKAAREQAAREEAARRAEEEALAAAAAAEEAAEEAEWRRVQGTAALEERLALQAQLCSHEPIPPLLSPSAMAKLPVELFILILRNEALDKADLCTRPPPPRSSGAGDGSDGHLFLLSDEEERLERYRASGLAPVVRHLKVTADTYDYEELTNVLYDRWMKRRQDLDARLDACLDDDDEDAIWHEFGDGLDCGSEAAYDYAGDEASELLKYGGEDEETLLKGIVRRFPHLFSLTIDFTLSDSDRAPLLGVAALPHAWTDLYMDAEIDLPKQEPEEVMKQLEEAGVSAGTEELIFSAVRMPYALGACPAVKRLVYSNCGAESLHRFLTEAHFPGVDILVVDTRLYSHHGLIPRYWGLKPPATIKALTLSGQTCPFYHDLLAASRLTHLHLRIALVDVGAGLRAKNKAQWTRKESEIRRALDPPYLNNLVSVTVVGNTRCQSRVTAPVTLAGQLGQGRRDAMPLIPTAACASDQENPNALVRRE
ncbi:hypothetical protein JCM10450v2_001935 [Rhodotorula kratochvilovae]